jgi:dipeptide/tripeptide permease
MPDFSTSTPLPASSAHFCARELRTQHLAPRPCLDTQAKTAYNPPKKRPSYHPVGIALIPMLSSWSTTALASCLFGLGFGLTQPLSMVMVADLSDPERPGLMMRIRFMVITLTYLLGPVLLGCLMKGAGLNAPFYASAFLVLAIGAYILAWKPGLLPERREAQ